MTIFTRLHPGSKKQPCLEPDGASFAAFWRCMERRTDLLARLRRVGDGRRAPRIPLPAILLATLAMFWFGLPSMLALDDQLRHNPALRRWLGLVGWKGSISDDTFADALDVLDLDGVRAVLHALGKRQLAGWGAGRFRQCALARRLDRVGSAALAARAVVALDGHHVFGCKSPKRRCEDCYRGTAGGTGHLPSHQMVVALWVGVHPAIVLDFEPIRPASGGEHGAGKRLVERLKRVYGDAIGVIVADALYDAEAFRHLVQTAGYRSVIIHKDPRRNGGEGLLDIDATDPERKHPHLRYNDERGRRYELWERDTKLGARRVISARRHDTDGHLCRRDCITDLPRDGANAAAVALLAETRWSIENTAFHELVGEWSLDRAFVHAGRPTAAWAIVCLALIAFNTLQIFAYRHLKLDPVRPARTLGSIRRELFCTLALFGLRGRPRARAP